MLLPAAGSLAAALVALVVVLGATGENGARDVAVNQPGAVTSGGSEAAIPADDAGAELDSSAGGGSGGSAGAGSADRKAAAPAPSATSVPPSAPQVQPVDPSPTAIAPARARKVERSAVLALRTPDAEFERTTDAVIATVARFDGIVANSQIGASDSMGGEATFELRIPTERLDRALAALSKLGHVTERNQSLQDITSSFSSAQERLTDARAERRGLLRALGRATTQTRIDAIKAQLRSVSSRIAGLKGELSSLRRRADLSRVDRHGARRRRERDGGRRGLDPRRRRRRRAARARGGRGRRARRTGGARTAGAARGRGRARRPRRTPPAARERTRSGLRPG